MAARLKFNIKTKEFLDLTFREFQILTKIWYDDRQTNIMAAYEAMRLQTYFQFALQVDKKSKKDFKQFCKELMPFHWDKNQTPPPDKKLLAMTPEDWEAKEKKSWTSDKKIVYSKFDPTKDSLI